MGKYDLIVVGAGTAGSMAAKTAAKKGLKVCLIDRKRRPEIGDKVCGDAIGKHHFDNLGLAYPRGEELDREILGIDVYSPDMRTVFRVREEGLHGFIINRLKFGQRLLNESLDAGATLLDETTALDLIIKNDKAIGILAKTPQTAREEFLAEVVIDASGHTGALRSKVPDDWLIDHSIKDSDVMACYREIREIKDGLENSEYCKICLDQKAAPGGYSWVFPKQEKTVNVGLGVQMRDSFPNPKKSLYDKVLPQPLFKESKVIHGGGGLVPTRRPIDCMVGDGFMLIGDSACQVNPIHGGGIGPSMIAGKLAAEVATQSIEKGDVSTSTLWSYNAQYMRAYGAKQASLDLFRIFLQKIGNDYINYGMENELIKESDLLKLSTGEELRLNITEKAERFLRGIGKLSLIVRLRDIANVMKEMKSLYSHYPEPREFHSWKRQLDRLYANVQGL